MAFTTYGNNGLSSISGNFSDVSIVYINLDTLAGVNTWKIYFNVIPFVDNVQLNAGLYDAYNGGGNRMVGIDSQVMSLYNNDIGNYITGNYIRLCHLGIGNIGNEGMHLSFELHNCNINYTERDVGTSRDDMARTVRGTWLAGKQSNSNYQMTDVGSFMGDTYSGVTSKYTSTVFPTGVESIGFYMTTGNMSGNYKAVPVLSV